MAFDGSSWDETHPNNNDLANELDDYQIDQKRGTRGRLALEHLWPSSQVATNEAGLHRYITLSTQTGAPGLVVGTNTQAGAIFALTSGTGVSILCRNSAGYEATLMQSSYLGGGIVPKGGIILWSGSIADIPIGWGLCDGTGGTVDLRDKFVIGAKQDDGTTPKTNVTGSLTQSGGEATHTLSVDEIPGHTHSGSTKGLGPGGTQTEIGIGFSGDPNTGSYTTGSTGGGNAHNTLPPYYALAYIQKL